MQNQSFYNYYIDFIPEIILFAGGLIAILIGLFLKKNTFVKTHAICFATISISLLSALNLYYTKSDQTSFFMDYQFNLFNKVVLLFVGLLLMPLMKSQASDNKIDFFEMPIILIFAILGMLTLIGANSLLTMFIGIEIQSLAFYIMVATKRHNIDNNEASIKYFLNGAIASSIIIFGISLIYATVGSVDYLHIKKYLINFPVQANLSNPLLENIFSHSPCIIIGLIMIIVGIGLKISLAPFHSWTPDAYQATPNFITAAIASLPKLSCIVGLINLCSGPFFGLSYYWGKILMLLASFSMMWGCIATLKQTNIKRLLGFSAISNMGFSIAVLAYNSNNAISYSLVYLIIYIMTTIGIFACLMIIKYKDFKIFYLHDIQRAKNHFPWTVFVLCILLFSQAGIPPMPGFFAKFYIIKIIINNNNWFLLTIVLITSVISLGYYLNFIRNLILEEDHSNKTIFIDNYVHDVSYENKPYYQDFPQGPVDAKTLNPLSPFSYDLNDGIIKKVSNSSLIHFLNLLILLCTIILSINPGVFLKYLTKLSFL